MCVCVEKCVTPSDFLPWHGLCLEHLSEEIGRGIVDHAQDGLQTLVTDVRARLDTTTNIINTWNPGWETTPLIRPPLMRDHPSCQTTPHKTTPLIRPPCLSDNHTPQTTMLVRPLLTRPPFVRLPCLSDHPVCQTTPQETTLLVRPPLLSYYPHETTILVSPPLGRPSLSSDHPSFNPLGPRPAAALSLWNPM